MPSTRQYKARVKIIAMFLFLYSQTVPAMLCQGHFVNPVTDVCWKCLFPLSIGGARVVSGPSGLSDTSNPKSPIGICGGRIGLQIGFWEPTALVDITDEPGCFPNIGLEIPFGDKYRRGGRLQTGNYSKQAFYHAHWYKYPLMSWLHLITDIGCMQGGDFDVLWMTELDPTWSSPELSLVLDPDAALFANIAAQTACAADSISSSTIGKPLDALFWCAGSHGSHYPLSGHLNEANSSIQMAWLLAERMNFKLHRQMQITDSVGIDGLTCKTMRYPVTPKSRYRYQLVNQVVDANACYPSGYSSMRMESLKHNPAQRDQWGFLIWRKRNCTFL